MSNSMDSVEFLSLVPKSHRTAPHTQLTRVGLPCMVWKLMVVVLMGGGLFTQLLFSRKKKTAQTGDRGRPLKPVDGRPQWLSHYDSVLEDGRVLYRSSVENFELTKAVVII